MKNINISKTDNRTWVVKADTERFGIQEIMFESYKREECVKYAEQYGYVERKRNVRKLDYKGMSFKENQDETFTVTSDKGKYQNVCATFGHATSWIYNMAANNDIGNEFVRKICEAYGCDTEGRAFREEGHLLW